MATYDIRPGSDGHDMQQNWEVEGPRQVTSHTTKQAALNEAERRASKGDTKIIRGTNGVIQDRRKHRGAESSSSEETEPFGINHPTTNMDYGEGTIKEQMPFFEE